MKNYIFKVYPTQYGSENPNTNESPKQSKIKKEIEYKKKSLAQPESSQIPCPLIQMPVPPQMPCPSMTPMPAPPQMPCPPMTPVSPHKPCPPGGCGVKPQYPVCPAPPFSSPYFRLAHSYVPWQYYNVVYNPAEALDKGTLFPELYIPQGEYGPCEGPRPCRLYFGGGVPCGE